MTRSRSVAFLATAVVAVLAALALAGCGGGSSDTTIGVANSGLGKVLVDSEGRTLYLFEQDAGTKSTCFGACADAWPPLRTNGKPTVGAGAEGSTVGTTTRAGGEPQVTYNGHPLYLYEGDRRSGDTNGQGITAFGAAWYALSPQGNQLSGEASSSGAGSSSDGGGGYY